MNFPAKPLETKTYTYFTREYVQNHIDIIEEASMLSPMDVANYYSIYKEFPVNYGTSSNGEYDKVEKLFGDKARVVSTYSRTDGYAKCVPYAKDPSNNRPLYHEFDIALIDSYSGHSRGVGRLVAFETGLAINSYNQGSYPVCYFTDDHYSTFQEYGNLGEFLPRFSAEKNILNLEWGEPSLVTQT